MSNCIKCGSKKAYWMIRDKENKSEYYCDPCFKKYDLADYKKEMDEYHNKKNEKEEESRQHAEITKNVTSWPVLLSAMSKLRDSPKSTGGGSSVLASSLFDYYAHQVIFVLLTGKLTKPEFFQSIPFCQITKEMIARATRYVENPPVPHMVEAFFGGLSPDRYQVVSGEVGRQTFPPIDGLIVQAASCLPRTNVKLNDEVGLGKLAYQAIRHYAGLPIVNYFFCLPYTDKAKDTKTLSPVDAEMTVYKGVEGLLLEIYEQLGEGQVINDPLVMGKVKKLMEG